MLCHACGLQDEVRPPALEKIGRHVRKVSQNPDAISSAAFVAFEIPRELHCDRDGVGLYLIGIKGCHVLRRRDC